MIQTKKISIDASWKCTLECYSCDRQRLKERNLPPARGKHSITLQEIKKMIAVYDHFIFCGQTSDPIFNDNLLEICKYLEKENKKISIRTAATDKRKDIDYYENFFKECPTIEWEFGLDGIDIKSSFHRINQDSYLILDAMILGAEMGCDITWQFIPFSFNEHEIEEAKRIASENGITLKLMFSSRFIENDPLKPKNNTLSSNIYEISS